MVKIDRHFLVHSALLLGQLSFGGGAIVAKIALRGKNPLVFAWLREFAAGLIFCARSGRNLKSIWHDRKLFFLGGFSMFVNHLCFIIGLTIADPISGTAWQPSQPILTCTLAVLLGLERPSLVKSLGISISVMGALMMVLCAPGAEGVLGTSAIVHVHHIFFFCNCLAASCYVLVTKELLKRHPPDQVTGWCYLVGSVFMLIGIMITRSSEDFLLPGLCGAEVASARFVDCVNDFWSLPPLWAVAYWLVFGSLLGYWLIAWANQFAQASIVSAYTVAQPMASCFISMILILTMGVKWAVHNGIRSPGVQDLGIVLIIVGLSILSREPSVQAKEEDDEGTRSGLVELAPMSPEQKTTNGDHKAAKGRLGHPHFLVNVEKIM
mmetsp:Transcript_43144/g.99405  ORF Transcript_43144/g.99405 Transcript_43144/m.99405 type:complete len:380 (-) Transcript_43144:54-1193(-)